MITHVGKGVFLGGQPRPYRKWAAPASAPQFWGFRSVYAHAL